MVSSTVSLFVNLLTERRKERNLIYLKSTMILEWLGRNRAKYADIGNFVFTATF